MKWWLKVRRTGWLAGAVVGYLLLLSLVGDERVPVISFAGTASAAAAALAPLLIMAALVAALASRDRHHEQLAGRRVWLGDWGLVVTTTAVACAGAWALRHGQPYAVEASRNFAGFVGTALVIRAVAGGRAAVAVTTAAVLLAIAFGHARRGLYPWAWPIADGSSTGAAAAALLLFVAGLVAVAVRGNQAEA